MEVALKIRGIYTTALTKFFMDKGLTIVSPSEAILNRFGDGTAMDPHRPLDLTIDDLENEQGILLEGYPGPLDHVLDLIREGFMDAICRKRVMDEHHGVAEVEFPYLAKSQLDELRSCVLPTLLHHHRLRIIASDYVDLMEEKQLAYHPEKRQIVSEDMEKRLIWDTYRVGKELGIDHVKLDGRIISLSEGEILHADKEQRKLTLRRAKFKGRSTYDGLNMPKEKGDYAISTVKQGNWFYEHKYFRRGGQLIGTYHNINTLVEFYPDKMRYVDLEIDVVRWPDGRAQIIDEEGLRRHMEAGFLSKTLTERAVQTARELEAMEPF